MGLFDNAKKKQEKEREREHLRRMKTDPEYAEKHWAAEKEKWAKRWASAEARRNKPTQAPSKTQEPTANTQSSIEDVLKKHMYEKLVTEIKRNRGNLNIAKINNECVFTAGGIQTPINIPNSPVVNGQLPSDMSLKMITMSIWADFVLLLEALGEEGGSNMQIEFADDDECTLMGQLATYLKQDWNITKLTEDDEIFLINSAAIEIGRMTNRLKRDFINVEPVVDALEQSGCPIDIVIDGDKIFTYCGNQQLTTRFIAPTVKNGRLVDFEDMVTCAALILGKIIDDYNNHLQRNGIERTVNIPQNKASFTTIKFVYTIHKQLNVVPMTETDVNAIKLVEKLNIR